MAIAISTLLARGLQFVWAILLARLLGEAGYGIWGVISSLIVIAATLPDFGMNLIVLRDVSRHRDHAGRYLAATLLLQPALALVAYAALVVIGLLSYGPPVSVLLWVAAGSLLLDALGNIGHNQLLALEKMVTTSTIVVTHIALQIVFTAAVLFAGGGLLGLYVATLAAGLLRAVLYWIALRRVGVSPHFPVQTDIVRVLLVGGLPLAISAFLALIYSHVDRLLVFSVLGEKQAGNVVSAFVVIFGVSEIISVTVLTALFPLMSRMAANQTDALRRLTDQLAMLTLLVSLPLAALVSGLAARLAAVLFPGFVSTSQVLELLIWQAVVQMVGNAYAQLMMVEARQIRLMLYRLAGLTVNIALNLLLLPRIGVQAVSISLLATHIVMLILFLIYRRPDSAARASLARQAGGMALAGVLMLGTLLVVRDINPILAALAGSALYVALIVALRVLRPEDWALLRRVVNNLPFVQRGRTV